MGSAPSSTLDKNKQKIEVVQITALQKLSSDNSSKNINKKQSPILMKNNTKNNTQQFTTSVEQMKFSKRNDLFKQRSKQTIMQLNNALSSLKKNQLLSTMEFKRLQKTQQLAPIKIEKSPINGQKKDRYHYKKVVLKKSQLAVRQKRTQSSINVSSLTSTYINQGNVLKSNQHDLTKQDKKFTQESQAIAELLMKKRQKQHIMSQNINRHQQKITKNIQQLQVIDNDSIQCHQMNPIKQSDLICNNNNMKKKKNNKFIKSEKFIPSRISDGGYWVQDVIELDGIQQR